MWLLKEAECVESLLQTLLASCFISQDIDPETLWIISFLVINDSELGSAWEREIICSQPIPVGFQSGLAGQDLQARVEIKWRGWLEHSTPGSKNPCHPQALGAGLRCGFNGWTQWSQRWWRGNLYKWLIRSWFAFYYNFSPFFNPSSPHPHMHQVFKERSCQPYLTPSVSCSGKIPGISQISWRNPPDLTRQEHLPEGKALWHSGLVWNPIWNFLSLSLLSTSAAQRKHELVWRGLPRQLTGTGAFILNQILTFGESLGKLDLSGDKLRASSATTPRFPWRCRSSSRPLSWHPHNQRVMELWNALGWKGSHSSAHPTP